MNSVNPNDYRIALLIDADNAPAAKVEVILSELAKHGVTNIRRAYGNWKKAELKAWEERLHEFAIQPMQQFDYTKGKNASDMAMVVDAMELLYLEKPQAFALVSSDADFTPLVIHLKAKGAVVYGFGQKHAPVPFQKACTKFLFLEQLIGLDFVESLSTAGAAMLIKPNGVNEPPSTESLDVAPVQIVAPAAKPVKQSAPGLKMTSAQLQRDNKLIGSLRESVTAVEDEAGWSRVGAVGSHMANKSSFDARNCGYPTLTKLLLATNAFELQDEGTSQVRVRIRRHPIAQGSKSTSPLSTSHASTKATLQKAANSPPGTLATTDIDSVHNVRQILLTVPEWEIGETKYLSVLGKPLRESDIKRNDEPLYAVFARYPQFFELAPIDSPKQVKLIKKP